VDASADRLLPVDAPSRRLYDRVQKLFGSDRALVVVLALPDVFSREGLEAVARISDRLDAMPEVEQVLSLATATNVHSIEDDIAVESFLEEIPEDAAGRESLRAAVLGNPLYGGSLVSRDARAAAARMARTRRRDHARH
jgi:predicted RND superfamily exporter protein